MELRGHEVAQLRGIVCAQPALRASPEESQAASPAWPLRHSLSPGIGVEACQATIEETRAWANFEIVEILHEREERDRAHFGGLRFQWEKRFEDPQDVLIQAELLKRKLPAKKPSRG